MLGVTSVLGGLAGALLLVRTSDRCVSAVVAVADARGRRDVHVRRQTPAGAEVRRRAIASVRARHAWRPALLGVVLVQLLIAIIRRLLRRRHGHHDAGDDGAGGMTNIHEMNGLKSFLGVAINGVALGHVHRHRRDFLAPGLIMVAGAMLGGYTVRRSRASSIPATSAAFVIVVGWMMTIYFFVR